MNQPTHATGANVTAAQPDRVPNANILSQDPLVYYVDDFITQADCTAIIDLAKDKMSRAVVAGGKEGVESKGRTNSVAWVAHDTNEKTLEIAQKVANTLDIPVEHAESFQVIHYKPGAEYRTHYDAFDVTSETGRRVMKKGGQRITTTLCYLNSVEAGGGTGFSKLGLEVTPKPGRLVVFNNCSGDSIVRTENSLHSGNPVEAGEKWAFNLWFREFPTSHNPMAED